MMNRAGVVVVAGAVIGASVLAARRFLSPARGRDVPLNAEQAALIDAVGSGSGSQSTAGGVPAVVLARDLPPPRPTFCVTCHTTLQAIW